MEYKALTPNLMVLDIDKTVQFYQDVLNFNVIEKVANEGKSVFAIVNAGATMLMFQEQESLKEEYHQLKACSNRAGITLYIQVTDIQQLYEMVKEKATIAKEMHTTFYGSTDFAIEDCNGYILTFSQPKQ
jgi:uncharacterized glyoxalase superfamily protein PhnB